MLGCSQFKNSLLHSDVESLSIFECCVSFVQSLYKYRMFGCLKLNLSPFWIFRSGIIAFIPVNYVVGFPLSKITLICLQLLFTVNLITEISWVLFNREHFDEKNLSKVKKYFDISRFNLASSHRYAHTGKIIKNKGRYKIPPKVELKIGNP